MADVAADGVDRKRDAVGVGQFAADLRDRPVPGEAAVPDPAQHVPADGPFGRRDRGFKLRAAGVGAAGAGVVGAAVEFAHQLDRPFEGVDAAMAVVADMHPAPADQAVPVEDVEFPESEIGVRRPMVRHAATSCLRAVPSKIGLPRQEFTPATPTFLALLRAVEKKRSCVGSVVPPACPDAGSLSPPRGIACFSAFSASPSRNSRSSRRSAASWSPINSDASFGSSDIAPPSSLAPNPATPGSFSRFPSLAIPFPMPNNDFAINFVGNDAAGESSDGEGFFPSDGGDKISSVACGGSTSVISNTSSANAAGCGSGRQSARCINFTRTCDDTANGSSRAYSSTRLPGRKTSPRRLANAWASSGSSAGASSASVGSHRCFASSRSATAPKFAPTNGLGSTTRKPSATAYTAGSGSRRRRRSRPHSSPESWLVSSSAPACVFSSRGFNWKGTFMPARPLPSPPGATPARSVAPRPP